MTHPQLVVFNPDAAIVARLRASLTLPYMSVVQSNWWQVAALVHLDAIWMTPMVALELAAVDPPYPLYRARVVAMRPREIALGFPPSVLVGVAIKQEDPDEPRWSLRLIISAMLEAIKTAREERGIEIERIGFHTGHLELDKLPLDEAQTIIDDVYRNA